jgi:hypothetical protein
MEAHQYKLKKEFRAEDLLRMGKGEAWAESLTADDFTIRLEVTLTDRDEARAFITRYEWLGSPPKRAYRQVVCLVEEKSTGTLAGVTWFSSPNASSNLLPGVPEYLLARGATASWTPMTPKPWLGTWMTTRAIDLLVQHTDGPVLVSGYADPEAGERGGIYRASNWIQVTDKGGAVKMYRDPNAKRPFWFSDRKFRCQATYKKFAKRLGIEDQLVWCTPRKPGGTSWTPDWTKTPPEVTATLKAAIDEWRRSCEERTVPRKSKWSIARGRNRKETRRLMALLAATAH